MNSSPTRFIAAAVLTATMALPLAAAAQQAPPAPPAGGPVQRNHHGHGGHYGRALRPLHLSDAQRQQTRRANVRQLRAQIDAILTPDQRTRLHNELRHGHRNNGAAPAAPPAPQG